MCDHCRKIEAERIIKEETRKINEKLNYLNHLDSICRNKDLTDEEFLSVYEGVLRNTIKMCESRLITSFSIKERYKKKVAKASYVLCTDESDPQSF